MNIESNTNAVKRCVVQLALYDRDRNEIFEAGSGAIVSNFGHILTAAHVVNGFFKRTNCIVLVAMFIADDQPTQYKFYCLQPISTVALLQKIVDKSLLDIAVLKIAGRIETHPTFFSGRMGPQAGGFLLRETAQAVESLPYLPFSRSPSSVSTGDPVQLYGYPVGANFDPTNIRLTIAQGNTAGQKPCGHCGRAHVAAGAKPADRGPRRCRTGARPAGRVP
jgi:hypothetical protein